MKAVHLSLSSHCNIGPWRLDSRCQIWGEPAVGCEWCQGMLLILAATLALPLHYVTQCGVVFLV